jgi:glycosyltransferase involved in cell wall biosynthesis
VILAFGDVNSPLILPRIAVLKELGEDIVIVANADCREITQSEFKVIKPHCFKNRTVRYLVNTIFTFWLILKHRPKLIVVHWASRLYQTLAFLPFSSRVVVSCMGGDIDKVQDFNDNKAFWARLLLTNVRAITVKSEYMCQMLRQNVKGIDDSHIHKVSWGVEERFVEPELDEQLQAYKGSATLFFCIRAMTPFYRKQEVLEAFFAFKKSTGSSAKLVVSTSRADKAYLGVLQEFVRGCDFTDDVLFLDVPHERMPSVLASCDAVVSFAPSDGLPQSFMEALSVGRYIIATDLAHYGELLVDGKNASLCREVSDIAKAFAKVDANRPKPLVDSAMVQILDRGFQTKNYLQLCKTVMANSAETN